MIVAFKIFVIFRSWNLVFTGYLIKKGEWIFILNKKLKFYTKELLKYFNIALIAFGLIFAIILIKYKPIYQVSVSGEELGYIQNKEAFEESLKENAIAEGKNVDHVEIKVNPEYELKLVDRAVDTNEEELVSDMKEEVVVTYKYYDIAVENQTVESVDTKEEAEEIVEQLKQEKPEEVNLSIIEKYTQEVENVETTEVEVAKTSITEKVNQKVQEMQEQKEEQKRLDSIPDINGIKLAVQPISGTITSRYGVSSRIRKSTHTGLDIATSSRTPIKVMAEGTVTCASYQGSYGNLVKIDHGNGVETWYGHTSKMYVKVGQKVNAGDVIASVGSTGNSTGPHLHLEIRLNGNHVNPQKYCYK